MAGFALEFWGHRGSQTDNAVARAYGRPAQPAENTLNAIALALDQGASGVEIDVMRTRDVPGQGLTAADVLVVTHSNDLSQHVFLPDGTPDRSHGFVRDRSLAELKALRVGPNREGEMPTLAEVMALLHAYEAKTGRAITLNIELKDAKDTAYPDPAAANVVDVVAQAIAEGPLPRERILVSSFARQDLIDMARKIDGVALGMLFYGKSGEAHDIYPSAPGHAFHVPFTPQAMHETMEQVTDSQGHPRLSALHPELGDISAAAMAEAAARKLAVNPWFMDEAPPSQNVERLREKVRLAREAGVEKMHLISNFAGEMRGLRLEGFTAPVQEGDAKPRAR